MTENQKPTEKRIITDLKAAGWVEATLGECQVGEEILLTPTGPICQPLPLTVTRFDRELCMVETSNGVLWADGASVLRAPRTKHEPGTVALITWDTDSDQEADFLPMRAIMGADGVWHGSEMDPPGESDRVEVVRVLLSADADTPKVTDEMVQAARQAEADWDASETPLDEYPPATQVYRFGAEVRKMRTILEAALVARQ